MHNYFYIFFLITYAMAAVRRQGVTIRTDASERAWRVVAPEGALIAHLQAFVHVLADLVGTRGETLVTETLETAVNVAAGAVSANVLHGQALVVIHATPSGLVQDVSGRTLASERAVRVDALAADTSVRHEQTFVQIHPSVIPSRSFRA